MKMMLKFYLLFFTMSLLITFHLPGHSKSSIYSIDFKTTGTVDVIDFTRSVLIDTTGNQSKEDFIFYKYWSVTRFEDYKNLFYPGEYPSIQEEYFKKWRAQISYSNITIAAKIKFKIKDKEFCIFPNGNGKGLILNAFMLKKINNVWYPVSSDENESYRELRDFFTIVRPEALAALFEISPYKNEAYINEKTLNSLKSLYVSGNKISGTALLSDINKMKINYSLPASQSSLALTYLYKPAPYGILRQTISDQDIQMTSYMDSLSISPDDKNKLMEMISRGLFLESAIQLQKLKNDDSTKPYAMRIREIYGEDKIRIYNTLEEKWR